ncbi:MAG: acyl-CoA dehydrogenase family protein [Halioglobus sp.]
MNFEFSEEQLFIREQANNFLAQESTSETVRKILDTDALYDRELWKKIVELGWTATNIPEEYGGLGLGFLELCVIAEELGRSLAPVPFSSSVYLATQALLMWGSEEQKQSYLPKLASGDLIGTLAMGESLGPLNIEACVIDGKLSGTKIPVPDGDIADFAVVAARGDKGDCQLFLIDLGDSQVQIESLGSIDPSRSLAKITFDGATAKRMGSAEQHDLSDLLDKAAVLYAYEQIGGGQAAMDLGMSYTKQRYAFGRPIASFQAIKHKFADMFVALELARSNAYYGAWALSSDAPDLPLAAATARVSASDAYYLISKENIQAHGGMGFTWEFDCHLYYRRAQLLSSIIGAQPQWKDAIATRLMRAA